MTTTDTIVEAPAVDDTRTGYIAGLRQLADLLEQHAELPLPWSGGPHSTLDVFVQTKDEAVAYSRAIPGRKDKDFTDGAYGFQLQGAIGGLHLRVYAPRGEVCERIVTGVETVTEQVPDPDALALVPTVEVTREVETVEWVCSPLLAEAVQA